jgi:putative chitinase
MFIDASTITELCRKNGYKPDATLVAGFVKAVTDCGEKYGINTPQRLACFIGQCLHESGGFMYFGESGYLSAAKRDSARKAKSYYPYYGRGPIQLTGNKKQTTGLNYEFASKAIFGDTRAVNDPDLFNDPYYGTLGSMWWWKANGANKLADTGANAVSAVVNPGDTQTFSKRSNYTNDTIKLFKTKMYNVTFKGATTATRQSLWNYLNVLGSYLKHK